MGKEELLPENITKTGKKFNALQGGIVVAGFKSVVVWIIYGVVYVFVEGVKSTH